MSIATVRAAFATAVGTISGITNASADVPDHVTPNHAVVYRKELVYDQDASGGTIYNYGVAVYANRTASAAAQDFLDTLAEPTGATSLRTVVETNSGVLSAISGGYVSVKSAGEPQQVTIGAIEYMAVEWIVEVVY